MQDAGAASPGLLALFGAVAIASIVAWVWMLFRWRARRPLVEFELRRSVPWGLADALLILGMWIVLPGVFYGLCLTLTRTEHAPIEWSKSAEGLRALMMATLLGNLFSVALGMAWLWLGRGARGRDLGLSARRLAGDVWLGVVAFAAVAVPVYVIQSVLVQFMPSEHPLVQLLHESDDVATAVLALLTAAVAAPLGEEFLFRLVLQGALERAEIQALPAPDEHRSAETAGLATDTNAYGVSDERRRTLDTTRHLGSGLANLTPDMLAGMSVNDRIRWLKSNILPLTKDRPHFDAFEIRLLDAKTGKLEPLLSIGLMPEAEGRELYAQPGNNGVTGFVAATGKSYLCDDTTADPLYFEGCAGAKISLTVPLVLHDELLLRDEVIGTFNVESRTPGAFSENDGQFLEALRLDVAVAVRALRLLLPERDSIFSGSVDAVYSTPPETVETGGTDSGRVRKWGLPLGVWPILITSTLFALMHWRHGPDPIPLFVLAVVLGYLYRQTHRIVPSIVVHFLLNSCSLAALWLQGRGPQ